VGDAGERCLLRLRIPETAEVHFYGAEISILRSAEHDRVEMLADLRAMRVELDEE